MWEIDMEDEVVLVDADDHEIGTAAKLAAHSEGGKLHRAVDVWLIDWKGRMLLQQRADSKYHAGGLWAMACSGHPRQGEAVEASAHRKLKGELGIDCDLVPAFKFTYRAYIGHGMTEHEYVHSFFGRYGEEPKPDPAEVKAWKYVPISEVAESIGKESGMYAPWFRIMFPAAFAALQKMKW